MTQLSEHFTLEEMTCSAAAARLGIDNTPGPAELENLTRTAAVMEKIRDLLNRPIFVHSGYRSIRVNVAVGGVATSAHCKGLACDFVCADFGTPFWVASKIAANIHSLELDQVILEYGWVHVGLSTNPPRCELLTKRSADSNYEVGILA